MITIQFDNERVTTDEIQSLSEAVQQIVSEVTEIEDVFVYANNSEIKVKTAPIELFIQMTSEKITDLDELTTTIKEQLSTWKEEHDNFDHPINLTVIPMQRKVEIGI